MSSGFRCRLGHSALSWQRPRWSEPPSRPARPSPPSEADRVSSASERLPSVYNLTARQRPAGKPQEGRRSALGISRWRPTISTANSKAMPMTPDGFRRVRHTYIAPQSSNGISKPLILRHHGGIPRSIPRMAEVPVISSHILHGMPAFLRHEIGERALLQANRAAGFDLELTEAPELLHPARGGGRICECRGKSGGRAQSRDPDGAADGRCQLRQFRALRAWRRHSRPIH